MKIQLSCFSFQSEPYVDPVMFQGLLQLLSEFWQNRPAVVVLSAVAVAILIYVIIDTHRHRRKRRRPTHQPHERSSHRHHY